MCIEKTNYFVVVWCLFDSEFVVLGGSSFGCGLCVSDDELIINLALDILENYLIENDFVIKSQTHYWIVTLLDLFEEQNVRIIQQITEQNLLRWK